MYFYKDINPVPPLLEQALLCSLNIKIFFHPGEEWHLLELHPIPPFLLLLFYFCLLCTKVSF